MIETICELVFPTTNHLQVIAIAIHVTAFVSICLFQMIHESSLMQLEGHHHQIEYLVADCNAIISMCLGGMINIWDPYTGEKLAQIDRTR